MIAASTERHATRRLDVRKSPDDASRIVAAIDTGTLVDVVASEGSWRYVRSSASPAEGWVEGAFLAGEGAAAAAPSFAAGVLEDIRPPRLAMPLPPADVPHGRPTPRVTTESR
ncbi:MAG: SH3 domain-containing protein [Rhizobiaceae bacterium]|nr:SH3 domain-containing protein [Rhizobiaceae bacterium]